MKIFSGSSNISLATSLAASLHLPLSPREKTVFPDSECRIQLKESVLDEDVIVVQSTSTPVDSHYMELFFLIDAVRRNGGKDITVVMPYMGYQRQDHLFRDGEAVSLEVIIRMLEAQNVKEIITFDLHSIKIPELFTIPIRHLSALPLFVEKIRQNIWDDKDSFLVSPDRGGIRRVKIISGLLKNMSFVSMKKERDLHTGHVSVLGIEGRIRQRALIIDDMISSGKTIIKAAEALKERGVREVFVFVTHPVFSDDAPRLLQESVVDKVFVTDSVELPDYKKFAKLEILSIAGMIAGELKGEIKEYENS